MANRQFPALCYLLVGNGTARRSGATTANASQPSSGGEPCRGDGERQDEGLPANVPEDLEADDKPEPSPEGLNSETLAAQEAGEARHSGNRGQRLVHGAALAGLVVGMLTTLLSRAAHASELLTHSGRGGQFFLVAAGACLGAVARYLLQSGYNSMWPAGTLAANLSGCFLAGLLSPYFHIWPAGARLFLLTGFLGALTTLSSFSLEAVLLLQRQQAALAAKYLLATVGGSLGACAAGAWLGSFLLFR